MYCNEIRFRDSLSPEHEYLLIFMIPWLLIQCHREGSLLCLWAKCLDNYSKDCNEISYIYEWHHEDKSKLLLQSPDFSSSATNRSKFSLIQHDVSTSTKWIGINRHSCSQRMNANNLTLLIPWPVLARVQYTVQRKCASGVAWEVCMDILVYTLFLMANTLF